MWRRKQESGYDGSAFDHLLQVVENDERSRRAKPFRKALERFARVEVAYPKLGGDSREHDVGLTDVRDRHEPGAGWEFDSKLGGQLTGNAGFPHPARTGNGDKARCRTTKHLLECSELALPTYEGGTKGE